ncbi:leucine-rich repeat-containing protein 15-like [Condylostylus longicornis]|uniref:leucine-rich repeat-containing protein 15-like n=1 Tax=Condylostylus longicornis TaxID=2530218 RepID=UPI00244E4E27|nr:leucine-rich repeat-containing protein 15-like [Condylostylus longicornis]XP_055377443.1 leucine-rich repeat-containing protein 15-like [Condylostylus longicornis]
MKNFNINIKKIFKLINLLIFLLFITIIIEKNEIYCKKIQIEDYCLGPICEYLFWKPDQDEVNIDKIFDSKKLLYFKNSIIPKIPIELFNVYPDLKQLSISNAYVEELPDNLTSNNLEFLYLSNNKLKSIENNVFKSLPNLKYLWLSNNQIEKINEFAFDDMDNLLFLELSNNEITELSDLLFQNIPKLTSLFLSKNKITTLQEGLFDNNTNLYQLNIDNNNILTIDENIFKEVKNLNVLDISFNPIKTLNLISVNIEKFISDSSSLVKLNVVGIIKQLHFIKTPIKKIKLNEPATLQTLTLNECFLKDLKMIGRFINLKVLNLSSNPSITLDKDSFKQFKYLEGLSLQYCNLNQLETGIFDNLADLKYLDISHNLIEEINLNTIRPMRNLNNISISGNSWNCCSLKSLIQYCQLRSITYKEEPRIEQPQGVHFAGINCIV